MGLLLIQSSRNLRQLASAVAFTTLAYLGLNVVIKEKLGLRLGAIFSVTELTLILSSVLSRKNLASLSSMSETKDKAKEKDLKLLCDIVSIYGVISNCKFSYLDLIVGFWGFG